MTPRITPTSYVEFDIGEIDKYFLTINQPKAITVHRETLKSKLVSIVRDPVHHKIYIVGDDKRVYTRKEWDDLGFDIKEIIYL